jgi:hypothetical protein
MGELIRFPPRLRPIQPITAEPVEIIDALIVAMGEDELCPACKGRGLFPFIDPATRAVAFADCPCGGDDENRIDLEDLGGAA